MKKIKRGKNKIANMKNNKKSHVSPSKKVVMFSEKNSYSDGNSARDLEKSNGITIENNTSDNKINQSNRCLSMSDMISSDPRMTKMGTEIAKHMINSTNISLQKFKKVAKQKGVPEVDPYDQMCEKSKLLAATGRRNFDRIELIDEINNETLDDRIKNVKSKFMDSVDPPTPPPKDLGKDPMKDFGLWDSCDPKLVAKAKGEKKEVEEDLIADLPDFKRSKQEKDEITKYLKDFNSLVIPESSVSKSKLSTGKYLSQADFEYCVSHTKFDESDILRWFKGFRKECPTGYFARDHVKRLFTKMFPAGNGTVFTNNIFRVFDNDNNGFMDFKEFLMALDVTTCKTSEDKLKWTFQLYDIDGNGTIDLQEMIAIIEILDELGGREVGETYMVLGEPEMLAPAEERAKEIMLAVDENGDGGISLEEWLVLGKRLFKYQPEEQQHITNDFENEMTVPPAKSLAIHNINQQLQNESVQTNLIMKKFNSVKRKSSMANQTNKGRAIAKHMMNTTKKSLQKFKTVAEQKGVPEVGPYDQMCERSKLLGGTGRRILETTEMFDEEDIKENHNNMDEKIKNAKVRYYLQ